MRRLRIGVADSKVWLLSATSQQMPTSRMSRPTVFQERSSPPRRGRRPHHRAFPQRRIRPGIGTAATSSVGEVAFVTGAGWRFQLRTSTDRGDTAEPAARERNSRFDHHDGLDRIAGRATRCHVVCDSETWTARHDQAIALDYAILDYAIDGIRANLVAPVTSPLLSLNDQSRWKRSWHRSIRSAEWPPQMKSVAPSVFSHPQNRPS